MKCPQCQHAMVQLFMSWACDHCELKDTERPSAVGLADFGCAVFSTGFIALDRITGIGGYPIGLTEVFGDSHSMLRCLLNCPFHMNLDLDNPVEAMQLMKQTAPRYSLLGLTVTGGTGQVYGTVAIALRNFAVAADLAIVLFNPHRKGDPFNSIAPLALKFEADIRIRLMQGRATVVKNRFAPPMATNLD